MSNQIFSIFFHYESEKSVMCGCVHFEYQGEVLKSFFPNPKAQSPLLKRYGGIILMG